MQQNQDKCTSGLLDQLPWDELGAVDELREVSDGLVRHGQAGQGPLLRVDLPTDLHVDHFHFLTVLQSLIREMMSQLIRATTEIQFSLCKQDVTYAEGQEGIYLCSIRVHAVFKGNVISGGFNLRK